MEALNLEGRAPRAIVIENVVGLLTSHGGADFTALCVALADQGYCFGALEIDASAFLPQSRARVFVLAVREPPLADLTGAGPFHSPALRAAQARLPDAIKDRWIWWSPPEAAARRNSDLASLLEADAVSIWRTAPQTQALLGQMAPLHRARVDVALASGQRQVGAVFRRMRVENGVRVQRAEVRFDGLAGCLRTPRGGSSRQILLVIDGGKVRSRLIGGREGARLMGLPEDYILPPSATGALHVIGDGVAAPVVRFLSEHLLEPLLSPRARIAAA